MKQQIEIYYEAKDNYNCSKHNYKTGDEVKLSKGYVYVCLNIIILLLMFQKELYNINRMGR